MTAVVLMVVTTLLVLVGAVLYVNEFVGWAQLFWVLASGSAGAGVMLLVRRYQIKGEEGRHE